MVGDNFAASELEGAMAVEGKEDDRLRNKPALERSEERFRQVVESAPNAIVMIGHTGLIEMVNAEAERVFGYTRNELLGKPVELLVPERYRSKHPKLRTSFFADAVSRPMGAGRDLYGLRKDGSEFPAEIGLNPIQTEDGTMVLSAIVDISARRRLEERIQATNRMLQEHLQLLEAVLENSAAVIYAKRKDGRYTYINHEWEVVCGLGRDQVLGKTDFDLFPRETAEQFRSNDLAVMAAGKLTESEERVETPWGEQLFLSKKVPLISPNGKVEGICGISTNITDSRRTELALREAITRLERERENKLMSLEAIMASIGHEVRQPLAALVANSSAALRFSKKTPPDYDEVWAALNRIVSDSHRVSAVFDTIRALFLKVDQARESIDVSELTLETLQLLSRELRDHGVSTHTELASEVPLIDGHRGQLQQVIINLVHNAIEAMDTVTDRSRVLRVRTEVHGDDAIMVVMEDSGPGIVSKRLEEIFDAFVTTKSDGMGLGLAICCRIIENHGGKISALSDGNNGAQFQIILPIGPRNTARAKMSN